MNRYGFYLIYQITRFGALTVEQMIRLCDGKATRSSIYRTLKKLKEADFVASVNDPNSEVRAYYATKEGREYALGEHTVLTPGTRPREINHTLACAEALLRISRHENISGISTSFELDAEEIKTFCHDRIPDGLFRLTQNGQHFELALEIESTSRSADRVRHLLNSYWTTFRSGMPCAGLVIAATTSTIFNLYSKLIAEMPEEFRTRVRLHQGIGFKDINTMAYGQIIPSLPKCWDQRGTLSKGSLSYSPIESGNVIKDDAFKPLIDLRGTNIKTGGFYSK